MKKEKAILKDGNYSKYVKIYKKKIWKKRK